MPRRICRDAFSLSLLALVFFAATGEARNVTGLSAVNVDGQTQITWDNLPGKGWTYHVVASDMPLLTTEDVWTYSYEIGVVGDSSAMDRRMSQLLGHVVTYRTRNGGPEEPIGRGLFVSTPFKTGSRYYAVWLDSLGLGLDFSVVIGQNTIELPVWEVLAPVKPIWQRSLTVPRCEDYVLFAPAVDTKYHQAMWSSDNFARHFGVIPGAPGGALLLTGHGRGGSFLNACASTGMPGETVIAPDDFLPTQDVSTFYLGYSTMYDPSQPDSRPLDCGEVVDYTDRFVLYTLDWAQAKFGSDPNRVYAMGASMGGTFAYFLAWHHPERIAAALSIIPKLRLGYSEDTAPSIIASFENMWSRLDMNLPLIQGLPVFDWMDATKLMQRYYTRGAAPVIGFVGRNDHIVGWAEKISFFQGLRENRAGGMWFWDRRTHMTPASQAAWAPVQENWAQLYQYRLDRSYPALSNCSADSDPGDGSAASGDTVGTINGFVQWDETFVDVTDRWECTLRPRPLPTRSGMLSANGVITVDVSPRRLQQFIVSDRTDYLYEVRNAQSGQLLANGVARTDDGYVLTVPAVTVAPEGSRVILRPVSQLAVGATPAQSLRLALAANPVRGSTRLSVEWPAEGPASVDVVDLAGRNARSLFSGVARGLTTISFDAGGLAPGVYLLHARQGNHQNSKRVVVVR